MGQNPAIWGQAGARQTTGGSHGLGGPPDDPIWPDLGGPGAISLLISHMGGSQDPQIWPWPARSGLKLPPPATQACHW